MLTEPGRASPARDVAPAPPLPRVADGRKPLPSRPLVIRIGKHLRRLIDPIIAASSLVPNGPVLDVRGFGWTAELRAHWRAVRDEAVAVALDGEAAPPLTAISPDQQAIAAPGELRSFFLQAYDYRIEENLARCPQTAALVAAIPQLHSALFSILAPGTHLPARRGVTKGLITCHLGLIVPRDGDARMKIGDRIVRWAEGETLVFDDTYPHEIWNETGGTRMVLSIQFRRPLRQPGRLIADLFLDAVRRSPFVQEARANLRRWNDAIRRRDI
nr:aspartyl/asparaginyl beta-hydroxylase domain-containing protein [Hephaestia sp. MAHUQ-44]